MKLALAACGLLIAVISGTALAQQIDLGMSTPAARSKQQHVELVSDTIDTVATKPQDVDLIFRVDSGFHINSHEPKAELLIPTTLKLESLAGVRVLSQQYPKGAPFKVAVGNETETLDVYTGEFRVSLRVILPRGTSTLSGTLHYQACDSAACFPPRDLPVTLTLTAK